MNNAIERQVVEDYIGQVEVHDTLLITDPCYEKGTWCTAQVELPKAVYNCYIEHEDYLMKSLTIVNEDNDNDLLEIGEELNSCGVDSGQLGIFNLDLYNVPVAEEEYRNSLDREFPYEDWKREYTGADTFYRCCCNYTLSNSKAGIINNVGVVTSTNGDGVYTPHILYSNGKRVGVQIRFMS